MISRKALMLTSAAVARTHEAFLGQKFDPPGWYGEMDAGWHVSGGTPCQLFSAHDIDHEALTLACAAQFAIPPAMFDQRENQQTNTVAAGEDLMAFWEAVLGRPYQIDMTLHGAERIDLVPALYAGL